MSCKRTIFGQKKCEVRFRINTSQDFFFVGITFGTAVFTLPRALFSFRALSPSMLSSIRFCSSLRCVTLFSSSCESEGGGSRPYLCIIFLGYVNPMPLPHAATAKWALVPSRQVAAPTTYDVPARRQQCVPFCR